MEDDTEILDWGHEDDEQGAQRVPQDTEDAVSLGGDEDDMQDYYGYQPSEQDVAATAAQLQNSYSMTQTKRDSLESKQSTAPPYEPDSPQLRRSQSLGKLTHALPPKPVVSVAPVHPSPAQASTLASSMIQRERWANGHGKHPSGSNHDALPPDWELREARSGSGEQYYYNVKTHESTWTRPTSDRSSPIKEGERGASHGREDASPPQRVDSPERRTIHKESTRPPDDLSYEDRHYRPGGAAPAPAAGSVPVSDRRDTRATRSPVQATLIDPHTAGRVSSLRSSSERRRTRSLSPRRDYPIQERSGRPRRDPTPPRAPFRDIAEGRHGTHSSRIPGSLDPSHSHRHSRVRDRQEPMEIDVSPRDVPADREKTNRRGPNDWSAPRTRSPLPQLRAPAPPGTNRFSRGSSPGSSQASIPPPPLPPLAPRQRPWTDRPERSRRPSPPRAYGDYSPADAVPQRRGREIDSSDAEYGFDTKRRRVDEERKDEPPSRRSSVMDVVTPHGLPVRPQVSFPSPAQDEHPRKRIPLPPQSDRFREVGTHPGPVQGSLLPSTIASEGGRRGYIDLPPRAPRDGDVPMRDANKPTNAPPLRRQGPPTTGELEFDGRGRPPSVRPAATNRPGSRFDELPTQGPRDYARARMNVDHSNNLPPQRGFDGPSRPAPPAYPDRPVDAPGDVPRGPRAMAREHMSNAPPPRFSTFDTQGPTPPHTNTWNMNNPSASRGSQRPAPRPALEINTPKQPSFVAPALKSVSGTNLIPIGSRKMPPAREQDAIHSPQDRLPPVNSFAAQRLPPRERDYAIAPELPLGGSDRPPMSIENVRRPSMSSVGRAAPLADRVPVRPVEDRDSLPARLRGNSYPERKDHGVRVSRFSPERPPPSVPARVNTEPRVWMTREESERLEMFNKDMKKPELTHKLPERPARTAPETWRPPDNSNTTTRFNGNSRGDRDAMNDFPRPSPTENIVAPPRQPEVVPPGFPASRRSPVDVRARGRRPSLEGRIGPSYDRYTPIAPLPASLPPRPVTRDVYPESAPRPDYIDKKDEDVRHDDTYTWDRHGNQPSRDISPENSATRIHPDRARMLHTVPGLSHAQEEPMKTSKPVRIRRPPPMAKEPPEAMSLPDRPLPEAQVDRADDVARPDSLRRTGSSLLDRLSLHDVVPRVSETSSPSLRERVDLFSNGPSGDGHTDYAMDSDMEESLGEGSRMKGGKRRVLRPKRGRRGGYPA